MWKKVLKITGIILAIGILAVALFFGNAFFGNPVSHLLAEASAKNYVSGTYSGTDYFVENVGYDFKIGDYYAHIRSKESGDSYFTVYIDWTGKVLRDTHHWQVEGGENTARRLDTAYRALTDSVFDSPSFPLSCSIAFGGLVIAPREYVGTEGVAEYSLVQEELVPDKIYDIAQLGKQAGQLTVYVEDKTVSPERAAEALLQLRKAMDEAGVTFYAVDFTLRKPKPEEGTWSEEQLDILQFFYADIYEDGMLQRVEEAAKETADYYREQDKKLFDGIK